MDNLTAFSTAYKARVDHVLQGWLTDAQAIAPRLKEAMSYSLFNGGKRVRPILCYASAVVVSKPNAVTDAAAAALECIHAYSLVHDDLPAMDDDDLRRGKPTCHIAFDEATAILVGDALQALAFEKLAESVDGVDVNGLEMLRRLAAGAGATGMVAGQMLDLQAEGSFKSLSLDDLERIHRHKTGALIGCSVAIGALSAGADNAQVESLSTYARALGLAFQVQDDIIDLTSDTETLGKLQGSDLEKGKCTYVEMLGLSGAKAKALELSEQALTSLSEFGQAADPLRWIANYNVDRRA